MGLELIMALVFGLGFYSGYQTKEYPELPKGCEEIIIKNGRTTCFKKIYDQRIK